MSLQDSVVPAENQQVNPESPQSSTLMASIASAVLPGTGHLLLHRWSAASLLLGTEVVLVGSVLLLRLPRFLRQWEVILIAWGLLHVVGALSALRSLSKNRRRPSRFWLIFLIPLAAYAGLTLCMITTMWAGFKPFAVPSSSMENTIYPDDGVMIDLHAFHKHPPTSYDLIAFRRQDGVVFIKRVIGVGGDSIEGRDDQVILNGAKISEPYIKHIEPEAQGSQTTFGPVHVPAGKLFVMGDNRDVSVDSRSAQIGLVDVKQVIGKPIYIYKSHHDDVRKTLR